MRMKIFWLAISLMMPASLQGQANAWDGTWKLNEAASYTPNPDFVVLVNSAGRYTFSDPVYPFSFFCNGKEFPASDDRAIACVMSTPKTMDLTFKKHGQEMAHGHRELSSDEKTVVSTVAYLTGYKETVTTQYRRLTGTGGFSGAWKKAEGAPPRRRTIVTGLKGSVLHIAFPTAKQYSDIPLGGTDAPIMGVDFAKATLSALPKGNHQFFITKKVDGSILQDGTLTLSDDCQTLILETWNPRNPSAKDKDIYNKQP